MKLANLEDGTTGLDATTRSLVRLLVTDVRAGMASQQGEVRVDVLPAVVHVEVDGRPAGVFGLVAELSDRWGLRHGAPGCVWFDLYR